MTRLLRLWPFFLGWSISSQPAPPAQASQAEVTFTRDVAPIFYDKCVLCHRPRDVAPMSLLTYDASRPWAKSIQRQVQSRRMPPFHAQPGDYQFANDISLSEAEIATIVSWVSEGAKRGHPDDLPPPPDFNKLEASHRLGPADRVLEAEESYVLAPGADEQRAFVLRNDFDDDVWISAIDYDSRSPVVHHLLALTDPTGLARRFDAEDQEPGFAISVYGGPRADRMMKIYVGGGGFLGSWAPGWVAREFGEDVGIRLRKGHDIVYQVHYWNGTGEVIEHRPKIGLYFNQQPVRRILRSGGPAADPHIFIAAGDTSARHEAEWIAPGDLHLFSAAPHMHFLGKSMVAKLHFPDGSQKTLLNVPNFQFEWQTGYVFREPVFLPQGTRVQMVSIHDNSAQNPLNPNRPPVDVTFGERSDDEMAECILTYALVKDEDFTAPGSVVSDAQRKARADAELAELLETVHRDPRNPRLQYEMGHLLMSRGDDEKALPFLRTAVGLVPDLEPALKDLAQALERSERPEEAAEIYGRVLKLDPENTALRFRRGRILESLGLKEEAAAELARVVGQDPLATEVVLKLAPLEEELGRHQEALRRYLLLIENGDLDPDRLGYVHFRVGILRASQDDAGDAMEHFRRATELAPNLSEAHLNLATLLGRNRRFEEATDRYQRVIELDPQNLAARFSQALALLLGREDGRAATRLGEALELHPESTDLTHLLARLLATSRDPQVRDGARALGLARQVFRGLPTADHAETLAMALAEVGRFKEAAELQGRLVAQVESAGRTDLLPAIRNRLVLYEGGEPCRAPWLE